MRDKVEIFYNEQLKEKNYQLLVKDIIEKKYTELPLAYIHSFGCQQNVAESEKLRGQMYEMGYGFTDNSEQADLILFNTCAVRENAHNRVFGNIGAIKTLKQTKKDMLIVLCGCMLQQEDVVLKIKESYPHIDIVFGTNAIHLFPKMVYDRFVGQKRVFVNEKESIIVEDLPVKREGSIKASLPIMQGCNNFCSYCIVPYVRGREISRTPERIIAEAKEIVAEGFKEITLLGQNVNSYGKDIGTDFASLLRELDKIKGDFWIKFMTSHPKDCSKELIDTIKESKHICHHIHLPIQSGSNKILDKMNRKYTAESYKNLVLYARENIEDITFSSDIIVGFPGETYEDFKETLSLLTDVRYDMLYTFIYSKRTGTAAANFEEVVTEKEKSKWMNELLKHQEVIGLEVNQALVGTTQRVLVDSVGKSGDGYIAGRNYSGKIVEFEGDQSLIGSFVDVKITKFMRWAVAGELIRNLED